MYTDVLVAFTMHDSFQKLEEEGCLNPLNETDMYCLHYVFLPRINSTLERFIESWNNHSLSSENSLTPNQLFIRGAIQQNMTPVIPSFTTGGISTRLPSVSNMLQYRRACFHLAHLYIMKWHEWTHWNYLMNLDVTYTKIYYLLLDNIY